MSKSTPAYPTSAARLIALGIVRSATTVPSWFVFRGSVIPNVIAPVFFITVYSAVLVLFLDSCKSLIACMGILPQALGNVAPMLSLVAGFLLAFRVNSAYDRYYEGRRLWANVQGACRNILRQMATWHAVAVPNLDSKRVKDITSFVKAFPFALKHHLRGERGVNLPDLINVLPDSYTGLFVNASSIDHPPQGMDSVAGLYETVAKDNEKLLLQRETSRPSLRPPVSVGPANLPLHLLLHLQTCVASSGDPVLASLCQPSIVVLNESLTGLERILDTPMPRAYGIHLKQIVLLYCLMVPLQLYPQLHAWTVPMTALIGFVFLGAERIGEEIENPFGFDENDLPLDQYCKRMAAEVDVIKAEMAI